MTSGRASSTTRPSRRRGARCRSATWATGRSTTTPATSRRRDYHELLREFLQSMCSRRLGEVYCTYAKRYRGYQVDPPVLELERARADHEGRPHGDPLQRVEALGRGGHDHARATEGRAQPGRDLPPRRRDRSSGARARAASTPSSLAAKELRTGADSRIAAAPSSRWSRPRSVGWAAPMAPRIILYTGQGRGREDQRGRGHRAALRRGGAAHRRALHRPAHSLSDSLETPLGGEPTAGRPTTSSARRFRPRRRWSATGRACRSGSATCWRSAAWTGSRPRS